MTNETKQSKNWRTVLVDSSSHAPSGFRSLATPTFRGSTTLFENARDVRDTWRTEEAPYTYGLYGTPTTFELAQRIAMLERAKHCLITPGGAGRDRPDLLGFLRDG